MRAASLAAERTSNMATDHSARRSVGSSESHSTGRSVATVVMDAARGWWSNKVAAQLSAIIGCDIRSAERYLAGDRTMNGEAVFALLRSEVGVKLIEAATRDLPQAERDRFWSEMAKATLRATIREQT